jgi:hypothetical protein
MVRTGAQHIANDTDGRNAAMPEVATKAIEARRQAILTERDFLGVIPEPVVHPGLLGG